MELSSTAQHIFGQISNKAIKLGDLRNIAKDIGKDHQLAIELWSTGAYFARQLAILIMDKKLLSREVIDDLDKDIQQHIPAEQNQLIDWLMANQLVKDKKTVALMESWVDSPSPLQRRIFWYYQARLRWVGQTPPANSEYLLSLIEKRIASEKPEVQWAMNFTAGQIGIFQEEFRSRCIALGEQTGLYKDEIVAKNCTPNYLPEFIAIQVAKLKK
ncbi:DNA alkylation repair protein [Parapedobacter indicus]|uniref:3-methyladenine DNA glycosylase AlkD n=1 Tax=Parapedobacter indicus TaxID=1477437 RepID=A0A1I3VJT3_9SPHI|nr:DNA alkylation repair protein [Parapedobacter indicus]PPK98276.1 3-methyladenine DNA glycosylase AlkD [Parapedobacter indicus]SFJ95319.1 3-methyladenine DNA glycosylase AlkD [Parapedobacter indicus]